MDTDVRYEGPKHALVLTGLKCKEHVVTRRSQGRRTGCRLHHPSHDESGHQWRHCQLMLMQDLIL